MTADFDSYWAGVDDSLGGQPSQPVLDPMPRHSSEYFDVSEVRLTSIGPYRIFAVLSIPKGKGPFPALLEVPRYGSVNNLPHYNDRSRYVVLTLMHRGQRLADQPFAAAYPGLLTLGIEDPHSYIYRGIVADCLRATEFILERGEVDPARVGVRGGDLALLTAARRPAFIAAQVDAPMLYRAMEARHYTDAYPIEELNDHLRESPTSAHLLERTLALFDPIHHAPAVTARTLVSIGDTPNADDRAWLQPLIDAVGGPVEERVLSFKGGVDNDWSDAWMAAQLGVAPMSRFQTGSR